MTKGLKIGKKEREILQNVGIGVALVGALIIPALPMALAPLMISEKTRKQNAKRSIKRLEEKDLIYLSGEKVKLTAKGKAMLKLIQAEDITIERPEKWDRIWRIVAYDIPDDHKKERDYFKTKLEGLGFVKVQESLYAHPFDCIQEIAVLAQTLGISPHVLYLKTDKLPKHSQYIKKFNLE